MPPPPPGAMNESSSKEITQGELFIVVNSMAKGKAPSDDMIPIEFFHQLWPTLGKDFYQMIRNSIKLGAFYKGVTRGLISLILRQHLRPLSIGDRLLFLLQSMRSLPKCYNLGYNSFE